MTPRLEDLITPPRQVVISPIKGIAGSLQPIGIGTFRYILKDDPGKYLQLFIPDVLYCPAIPLTLISPQCLCKLIGQTHTSKFIITEDKCYLHIHDRCSTIKYDQHGYKNLPTIEANMATDKHENLHCQTCYIDQSKKDTNKTTFYDKNPIHLFNVPIHT